MSVNDSVTQARRDTVLQAVIAHHGEPPAECEPPSDLPRWLGLEVDHGNIPWFSFTDFQSEMFAGWESDDSDYEPHLLIDLDTGHGYLVTVKYGARPKVYHTYEAAEEPEDELPMTADVFDALDAALDRYADSFEGAEAQHYTEAELSAAHDRIGKARQWLAEQGAVTSDSSSALPGA